LIFTSDGGTLIAGYRDAAKICFWDVEQRGAKPRLTISADSFQMMADRKTLVCHEGQKISTIDLADPEQPQPLDVPRSWSLPMLQTHPPLLNTYVHSQDGPFHLFERTTIHLHDPRTGQVLGSYQVQGGAGCVCMPDESSVMLVTRPQFSALPQLALWDLPPPSANPLRQVAALAALTVAFGLAMWLVRRREINPFHCREPKDTRGSPTAGGGNAV
jgi:hypothetical protein